MSRNFGIKKNFTLSKVFGHTVDQNKDRNRLDLKLLLHKALFIFMSHMTKINRFMQIIFFWTHGICSRQFLFYTIQILYLLLHISPTVFNRHARNISKTELFGVSQAYIKYLNALEHAAVIIKFMFLPGSSIAKLLIKILTQTQDIIIL